MKRAFYCIKLPIQGGLHLGNGVDSFERSQDLWQSDAIKSALYASLNYLCGIETPSGTEFFSSFKISSAFPYSENRLFFPIPRFADVQWADVPEVERIKYRKKRKKLQWIDQDLFEQTLHARPIHISESKLLKGSYASVNAFRMEAELPFAEELMERVTLSRTPVEGKLSTPFYFRKLRFGRNCGLFFLLETQFDQTWLERYVFPALRLLGDEGIGSDRSAGGAWFDFNPKDHCNTIHLDVPDSSLFWMGMGNFAPTLDYWDKVDEKLSSWLWEKRGGYIASPSNPQAMNLRKKSVYMLKTGSILASSIVPEGRLFDLSPNLEHLPEEKKSALNHPIWRDAAPIFLPIKPVVRQTIQR